MRKYIRGAKVLRPEGWVRRNSELWFQVDTERFIQSLIEHSKDGKINLLINKDREGKFYIEVDQHHVFND